MIQIRNNVFETNSSSTHSICISKKPAPIGNYVSFHLGNYGWEEGEANIRDYLYTAIMCHDYYIKHYPEYAKDMEPLLPKLKDILDKNGIRYDLEYPFYDEDGWPNFDIDHDNETYDFVEAVINDEDMLMRTLFNADSVVYTGNDNRWWGEDDMPMCDVAAEYNFVKNGEDWEWKKTGNWGHPYYDPDNFDYFYKGN